MSVGSPNGEAASSRSSYYVEMRDGTKVALTVYLPAVASEERVSAILVQTRYGRESLLEPFKASLADGFALAFVDTRGSTSSFGLRRVDIGPAEISDMDTLIAHLAAQPWSDGIVFAQGTSYMADTADIATSRPAPALKAAVIRQVDFDVFLHLFFPGGVANEWFLSNWGDATREADEGRHPNPERGLDCLARVEDCPELWPILAPVDDDEDYSLLREALAGRDRWRPEDYAQLNFHDDAGENGYAFFDSSPAAHLDGIVRESKPAQVWGSWMDAGTAEAALARYRSAPTVPMELWITGNDHGNTRLADPLLPDEHAPRPSLEQQHAIITGFYETVRNAGHVERSINYYVLGADEFRRTSTWPPTGVETVDLHLGDERRLRLDAPQPGSLVYEVDFSHGTGDQTRWSTQFGTPPAYPDRREADESLLVFDTEPFEQDMELVGRPVLELYMASASSDPAVHAYLEAVAPDGGVRYLTEGMFRVVHRTPAQSSALPYDMGPAPHTYRRADAAPVTPGEIMRVEFALLPVAARIKAGHRLRLALAGADVSYFRRYSEGGPDTFEIRYGADEASKVSVPLRAWDVDGDAG